MIEQALRKRILTGGLCCLGLHIAWLIYCVHRVATIGEVGLIWYFARFFVPGTCTFIAFFSVPIRPFKRISLALACLLFFWLIFDPTTRIGALIGWQFNDGSETFRMLWDGSLEFRG
jgi:hypothetical protein